MHRDGEKPDLWHGAFTPDEMGAWTFEIEAWSDPVATWRHNAEIKIPAGIDVELMFTEGALLLERLAKSLPKRSPGRRTVADALKAVTRHDPPRPGPVRRGGLPRDRRAARRGTAARPGHDRGALPVLRRPGAGAVQRLVRVLPALRGRLRRREDRQDRLRHAAHRRRSGSTRSPRWASTSSTCRRSTRSARLNRKGAQQHARPRPRRPGLARGRSARRRAATTRSTPTSAPIEDFDAFVAAGPRARPRGRARPRAAGGARPPLGQQAPRVVHHPRRRLDRLRREPAEEVPGHLPDQLRQRPRGHLRRGAADRPARGCRTASGSSAWTTRTPSRCEFWEWLLGRGPQDRPRRAVPVRGVHQARDDAGARHGRLPPVLLLLHLAQREVGDRGVLPGGRPRDQPRAAPELLGQHPRHPAVLPPVRRSRGVQDPRRARRDRRHRAGASTPASSCSSTSRCSPARRSTSTRRSSRSGSATGTPPSAGAHAQRRTSPGSTRSAAPTPRSSSCAT